jgi:hypothetical protein
VASQDGFFSITEFLRALCLFIAVTALQVFFNEELTVFPVQAWESQNKQMVNDNH